MTRRRLATAVTLIVMTSCGTTAPMRDPFANSRQLVLVLTDDRSSTTGTLERFEREAGGEWRSAGPTVPVVVGRNGIAAPEQKREGDGRAPAGVFPLGTAFGFAPSVSLRVPYRALRDTTECVDDSASRYYNEIVDRDNVPAVDWSSSEKMRRIGQYELGMVVNYNTPAQSQRGSCIFLHIWGGPSSTTSGCTAMSQQDLETLLRWLDASANPRLVQYMRNDVPRTLMLP